MKNFALLQIIIPEEHQSKKGFLQSKKNILDAIKENRYNFKTDWIGTKEEVEAYKRKLYLTIDKPDNSCYLIIQTRDDLDVLKRKDTEIDVILIEQMIYRYISIADRGTKHFLFNFNPALAVHVGPQHSPPIKAKWIDSLIQWGHFTAKGRDVVPIIASYLNTEPADDKDDSQDLATLNSFD